MNSSTMQLSDRERNLCLVCDPQRGQRLPSVAEATTNQNEIVIRFSFLPTMYRFFFFEKVIGMEDNGTRIKVKYVPRLDLRPPVDGEEPRRRGAFGVHRGKIPPARFFDPAEIRLSLFRVFCV